MHHKLAVFLISLAQHAAKLVQVSGVFAGAAPRNGIRRLSLGEVRSLGRLVTVVEKLVHGNLQSPSHLFHRFNGGNGVPVFHARDIAAKQAGALLNVTLGEFSRAQRTNQDDENEEV